MCSVRGTVLVIISGVFSGGMCCCNIMLDINKSCVFVEPQQSSYGLLC